LEEQGRVRKVPRYQAPALSRLPYSRLLSPARAWPAACCPPLEEDAVIFYKLALLLVSGGALLSIGSCGRWALDALYVLPQFADFFQSLTDTTT
jgi:hypothetical protein